MKKGQLQMSFGMIFSIIIIIATVAVGAYVIMHFISLSECTKISLFYSSMQGEASKAWEGDMTQKIFKGELPSKFDKVCIGNLSLSSPKAYENEYENLKRFSGQNKNLFLYPLSTSCGSDKSLFKLEHIQSVQLFCVPVKSGSTSIKISKDTSDSLVKLSAP